jgi:CHAD domain-containing protein
MNQSETSITTRLFSLVQELQEEMKTCLANGFLDGKAIHFLRVGIKQRRAMWHLFAKAGDRKWREARQSNLKLASRKLGELRDDQVIRELAKEYFPGKNVIQSSGVTAQNRPLVPTGFQEALDEDANEWQKLATATTEIPSWEKGYKRAWRKAVGLAKLCDTMDTPENYHHLRRWVKYLFYQRVFLEAAGVKREPNLRENLQKLGHLLGRRHDLHHLFECLNPIHTEIDPAGWKQMTFADSKLAHDCAKLRTALFCA